jgi:NAD(P)-dependent dehydrogenase (short-subunit alcohol dehydrogenase family)
MATVLITGANRGIGLELARLYAQRGDHIIAVGRRRSDALDALGVRFEQLDVTDDAGVLALRKRLEGVSIDLLVHNAGLLHMNPLDNLDFGNIRAMLEVNAIGPLKLTVALRSNLSKGSKIAILTSRMGSITDNTSGGAYGYRMSKAAVNAAAGSMAVDLAPAGIAVVLLHPGWVRTGMTGGRGLIDADASAAGLVARIDETTLENTGRFVHMSGEALPW